MGTVKQAVTKVVTTVKQVAAAVVKKVTTTAAAVVKAAVNTVKAVAKAVTTAVKTVKKVVTSAVKTVTTKVKQVAATAAKAVNTAAQAAGGAIVQAGAFVASQVSDEAQLVLDVVGLIPVVGEFADGANAIIYAAKGDYANAALSAAAMIPIGGQAATGLKLGIKGVNAAIDAGKAATRTLPKALTVGKNAEAGVHVYTGVRGGSNVYVGITNNIARRQTEHADRFVLQRITGETGLTRGQARAVEQAMIERNPGFENLRNSISPSHSYYRDAVDWGEQWLTTNGFPR